MPIYISTYKQVNNMDEIIKFLFVMVIYLFMFTIVIDGKFIFAKKKKKIKLFFLILYVLNVLLHITNNIFFFFKFVIIATSFCDSVKDCRKPAFFCEPPKIARCVMLFCRCD